MLPGEAMQAPRSTAFVDYIVFTPATDVLSTRSHHPSQLSRIAKSLASPTPPYVALSAVQSSSAHGSVCRPAVQIAFVQCFGAHSHLSPSPVPSHPEVGQGLDLLAQ